MKKEINFSYNEFESIQFVDSEGQDLISQAQIIAETAYAPYSNFKVGCALLLDDDSIVLGNNQENAAYPSGLCAERNALFYASANFPNSKVKRLAVWCIGKVDDIPLSPCGACRQVISEYEQKQRLEIEILFQGGNGKIFSFHGIHNLLPFPFDIKSLSK